MRRSRLIFRELCTGADQRKGPIKYNCSNPSSKENAAAVRIRCPAGLRRLIRTKSKQAKGTAPQAPGEYETDEYVCRQGRTKKEVDQTAILYCSIELRIISNNGSSDPKNFLDPNYLQALYALISPLVEASCEVISPSCSSSGRILFASCLPSSTPHRSNVKMFQMMPCTKILCSYKAIS